MKFSHIIITLALILLCSLSAWQLQRGLSKQAMFEKMANQSQLTLLSEKDLSTIAQYPKSFDYREIKLTGQFLNNQIILLDNKINNGHVGYHVISPFLTPQNQLVFVNRGWIPMGESRAVLPSVEPILHNPITITGQLEIPRKNRFIKNTIESFGSETLIRIQEIDIGLFTSMLDPILNSDPGRHGDRPLLILNLSPDSLFSFEPIPKKAIWLNPKKHYAYAIQWLLLALSLGIIYTIAYRKS